MFLSNTTSVLHQTVDHFSTQPPLFNRLWTQPTQPWTTTRARAILLHFSKMFLVFMETFSPRLQPPILKSPFKAPMLANGCQPKSPSYCLPHWWQGYRLLGLWPTDLWTLVSPTFLLAFDFVTFSYLYAWAQQAISYLHHEVNEYKVAKQVFPSYDIIDGIKEGLRGPLESERLAPSKCKHLV